MRLPPAAVLWRPPATPAGARRSSACHEQGLPPDMNIREVAADIKTYQRLNRAAGSGGSVAAAAGGLEVTADTPREEKQRQYGLKGPALQAQVGAWRPPWGTLSGCMPMSTYPWTHTSLPALWVALAALSGVCRALSACPCCAAAPAPPGAVHPAVQPRHAARPGAEPGRLLLPSRRAPRAAGAHAQHVGWVACSGGRCWVLALLTGAACRAVLGAGGCRLQGAHCAGVCWCVHRAGRCKQALAGACGS